MSFIHKKTRCSKPQRWQACGRKFSWWAKFSKHWSKKKVKLAPWMEEGPQNLLAQIRSHGVLWISRIINVLSLSNGDHKGGYGVVCKA
jgi:hypothetical protein